MTGSPSRIRLIQEIFNDYNGVAYKQALQQLDVALDESWPVIVVEPKRLADETRRWIKLCNFLYHFAWGVDAVCTVVVLMTSGRRSPSLHLAMIGVSVSLHGFYHLSWLSDPCSNYRIESDENRLDGIYREINNQHAASGNNSSLTVLVLANEFNRKRRRLNFASTFSIFAVTVVKLFCCWLF